MLKIRRNVVSFDLNDGVRKSRGRHHSPEAMLFSCRRMPQLVEDKYLKQYNIYIDEGKPASQSGPLLPNTLLISRNVHKHLAYYFVNTGAHLQETAMSL